MLWSKYCPTASEQFVPSLSCSSVLHGARPFGISKSYKYWSLFGTHNALAERARGWGPVWSEGENLIDRTAAMLSDSHTPWQEGRGKVECTAEAALVPVLWDL